MKTKMFEIKCNQCESEWMIKCETLVHSKMETALKEELLKEAFFTKKCSKCGNLITFYYPFIYCDMENKFLIALASEHTKWVKELDELEQYKDFKKRLVIDGKQLKEKINIFENHLEDEGIALIKEKLKDMYQSLHFESLDNDLLWFISDKGPIGIERRFYAPVDSKSKTFIYV